MNTSYWIMATFERHVTLDDFQQIGGGWELLWNAFVSVLPIGAQELVESQQVESRVSHRVKTHWREGLRPQDRMKLAKTAAIDPGEPTADVNFRLFEIQRVLNVGERNRELELLVAEVF